MTEARTGVCERIEGEVRRRKIPERAFIVGVTGIDCSGKTRFATGLEEFLQKRGQQAMTVHLDDFHRPAALRHAGANRDEDHYQRVKEGRVFDFTRLVNEVLRPAREGQTFTVWLTTVDWQTDAAGTRELTITPNTIVILEGVFLLLESVRPHLDYVIFLNISEAECLRRAGKRDPEPVYRKYATRYLPAAWYYLADYPPAKNADLVVDNNDWRAPRLK